MDLQDAGQNPWDYWASILGPAPDGGDGNSGGGSTTLPKSIPLADIVQSLPPGGLGGGAPAPNAPPPSIFDPPPAGGGLGPQAAVRPPAPPAGLSSIFPSMDGKPPEPPPALPMSLPPAPGGPGQASQGQGSPLGPGPMQPPQGQPAASPMQPPVPQQTNHLGDVADQLLTGGAFKSARDAELQQRMQVYKMQQMQQFAQSLPPSERQLFLMNPQGYLANQEAVRLAQGTEAAKNLAPMALTSDQRQVAAGNTINAAPGTYSVDNGSGAVLNSTLGPTGQVLGGNVNATTGVSERTGQQFPVQTWHDIDPTHVGDYRAPTMAGAPGQPPAGSSAQPPQGGNGINPVAYFQNLTGKFEGGYNPKDLNGAPTIHGFNLKANPDINPQQFSDQDAANRFAQTYWAKSGAANLPAALAIPYADTYFRNPAVATHLLAQSNGDPQAFIQGVRDWQDGIIKKNPAAGKYADAWNNRVNALAQASAATQGAGAPGAPQGGPAGLSPSAMGGLTPRPASPQEMAQAGYAPGTAGQMVPGKGISVTQTPQQAGNFSAADSGRVKAMGEEADRAQNVAAMSTEFMNHYKEKGSATGPGYMPVEIPLPFHLGEIPLNPVAKFGAEGNAPIGAMKGLTSRAAPMMRPEGSGRIMGQEYANFLRAFPNIENMGDTNARIHQDLQSDAQRSQVKSAFFRSYLQQHGNLVGADDAFSHAQSQAQAPSQTAPRILSYNPKTGGLE